MLQHLLVLEADTNISLQQQIKQKLIEAINHGYFPAGCKMPSSRKLAEQLDVARNTVVFAYQQLTDEGYLKSRERSGIYVSESLQPQFDCSAAITPSEQQCLWSQRINQPAPDKLPPPYPDNWQEYPYPFIAGQFDLSLFPVNPWRECSRLTMNVNEITTWASDSGSMDDLFLIDEIRTKVLPRRGIFAQPDEILITIGSQQGLYLLSELLLDEQTLLAMEEPGYAGMRKLAEHRRAVVDLVDVDNNGIQIDAINHHIDAVYVTPSHQVPTAVTLSQARREQLISKANEHDFIIIEDDYECEANFISNPHPAIKSLDCQGRVIYLSSFSNVLAPGLRLGYMVAPAEFIKAARELRSLCVRHPPANNQRTMALFISLGYYDTVMRKLNQTLQQRWQELREALNHYLPTAIVTSHSVGGSACWIKGPKHLNSQQFATQAAKKGILIESVTRYYGRDNKPEYYFRLGVSSIEVEKIRAGVQLLAQIFWQNHENDDEHLPADAVSLSNEQLPDFMADCEFIGRTVFGEPYRIKLFADGTMQGWEGHHNEKTDTGQWWLEGDTWFRQWQKWSYGEVLGFNIAVHSKQIFWLRDGKLVDSAFFTKKSPLSSTVIAVGLNKKS
ncbi:PLP-dependent aminotransferase family protein [Thalassotalea mangrovi]|uniref:Aminotransferase class I/II-fold pyridoxal phosphate-dependent enzyme n=1 Tax=Thalassotalea mangrovi TaxID=2572245 RepID=A0A4U1B4Z5_9GAMM|nr:aminotransferase class I/II-fold pyridoxal phosphate-dependent enzyme [Thalassotalea mangrovi]TKB45389.1 aminotransferase class I/II-fold pyridoxal phosphate-dependent enzyme [Thalassotalea mangrovi]